MKKKCLAGVLGLLLPGAFLAAQAPTTKTVPPGTPVTITVTPAAPSSPSVSLTLLGRHGHGTPHRQGFTHTGGGTTDVAQPSPDTVVITMTGVAVAGGHPCKHSAAGLDFDLEQCFEVAFEKPDVKAAKLTLEGRVLGLLRSHGHGGGSAEQGQACATVSAGPAALLTLCVPPHAVAGGQNLSLNCHEGPVSVPVRPGKYTLHQVFHLAATHPRALLPCKAASAELAPDPALDPLWISYFEPFHGAQKKDFGFQVTLKVAPEEAKEANGAAGKDGPEKSALPPAPAP
jgi:hypothetical protein